MSIAKDVLQAEVSKHEGYAARIAHERHDRMGRLLAMGDRWLEDNEAQVREEFPELFPPVPTEADKFRATLENVAGGKDALIDGLLEKNDRLEAALAVASARVVVLGEENAGLKAQIDEIHAAKASDKPAGEDTLPPATPVPDLPTA